MRAALALQLIPRLRDQHIFTILKQHGRAAVVLPDNVDSSRPLVGLCPALRAVHVAPLPAGSILIEGGAGECLRGSAIQK